MLLLIVHAVCALALTKSLHNSILSKQSKGPINLIRDGVKTASPKAVHYCRQRLSLSNLIYRTKVWIDVKVQAYLFGGLYNIVA